MRRYGHQCQTLFGLFNSFFLSPPIRCISHFLSVYISRSLCLAFSPRLLTTPISPLLIFPRRETKTAQAHHWSLTHFATKRNSSVKNTVAGSENFHQQRRWRRFGMWVCLIWLMGCGLLNFIIDLVDLGCGFVWFGGCRFVPMVDVGLCRWWMSGGGCGFVPVMDVGLCRWWV